MSPFFDPMVCPCCGGAMRVLAFLTEHAVVDRIIEHLKLTFVAEGPRRLRPLFRSSFGMPTRRFEYYT